MTLHPPLSPPKVGGYSQEEEPRNLPRSNVGKLVNIPNLIVKLSSTLLNFRKGKENPVHSSYHIHNKMDNQHIENPPTTPPPPIIPKAPQRAITRSEYPTHSSNSITITYRNIFLPYVPIGARNKSPRSLSNRALDYSNSSDTLMTFPH